MRTTIILAAIASVVVADWSYTGPSYTMTADVWTSSCTDGTAIPASTTGRGSKSDSPSASATASASGSAYSHSSHGGSWGSSAAAESTASGWDYSAPAGSTAAGWGSSAPAAEATWGPSSVVSVYSSASAVPAATYTGAANQKVVGAGVVAAAGLAMLL